MCEGEFEVDGGVVAGQWAFVENQWIEACILIPRD